MALNARARSGTLPITLLVMAILAGVPLLSVPDRMLSAMTFALVYAIAGVGLDVFSGYSGQPSFGNFGFVAVGAYTSAMLTTNAGWSVLATLPASVAASVAASLIIGLPMIRLPGLGGALLTYFFAFVMMVLIGGQSFQNWTMGANGIPVDPPMIGTLDFTKGLPLYYLGWIVLLAVALVADRYANSRAGRALRVIKRGELLASSMGIDVRSAKLFAFIFSAAVAGLGGWVFAQALGYLSPESFPGMESVNLVAMAVVGGLGSICGPIIGAMFFGVVSEVTRGAGASRDLVFAALLLAAGCADLPARGCVQHPRSAGYAGTRNDVRHGRRQEPARRAPEDRHRHRSGAVRSSAVGQARDASDGRTGQSALRWRQGARRHRYRGEAGRDLRHHGAERRRQDHPAELHQRDSNL